MQIIYLVTYCGDVIFLFNLFQVLSSKLIAPPPRNSNQTQNTSTTTDTVENLWGYSTPSPIEHDYSSCCAMKKVNFIGLIFMFNNIIFSAKIRFPVYSNFYIDRWQIDALVFVTSRISCMAPLAVIPLNVKMIFQRSLNAWQVNCTTFCF